MQKNVRSSTSVEKIETQRLFLMMKDGKVLIFWRTQMTLNTNQGTFISNFSKQIRNQMVCWPSRQEQRHLAPITYLKNHMQNWSPNLGKKIITTKVVQGRSHNWFIDGHYIDWIEWGCRRVWLPCLLLFILSPFFLIFSVLNVLLWRSSSLFM